MCHCTLGFRILRTWVRLDETLRRLVPLGVFGPPKGVRSVDESAIAVLEAKAEEASLGFRWIPLNRAGDLCEKGGDRPRALTFYGRAIDAMLEDGQPEPARGIATKIVRIHPEAIRTLCTLTWLDLASDHMASGMEHLGRYVEAAKRGGRETLAVEQVFEMAKLVPRREFLDVAAEVLDQLGHEERANQVREWAEAGKAPNAVEEPHDLRERCLSCAIGSNFQKVDRTSNRHDSAFPRDSSSGLADSSEWKSLPSDPQRPASPPGRSPQ